MEKNTKKEPLTPTTEGETFESWTLVADPSAKPDIQLSCIDKPGADDHSRIEDLEKESDSQRSTDENLDDLSDGISIISESESAGRLTPHPNAECSSCDETINLTETTNRQKKRAAAYAPLTPPQTPSEVKQEPSPATSPKFSKALAPIRRDVVESDNADRPFIRLSPIFFYLSVIVALIAFVGKVMYPEWVPASTNEHMSPLTQKIDDLELQNNLLRAEIDLLSKQVNYMNQQKDNRKYNKNEQKYYSNDQEYSGKKEEKLKVWPGGGDDSLKPMKILKGELYTPPKLEDFPNKKIHESIIDADILTEIPVSKIVVQSIKDQVIEPALGVNLNEKKTDQAALPVNERSYKDNTAKNDYRKELPKNQMYKGEKYDSESQHYDKKMKYAEKQYKSVDDNQDRKSGKNDYNKENNYKGHYKDKYDTKYDYKKDNDKFQRFEKDKRDHYDSKEYEKRDFNNKKLKNKDDKNYDDDWHNKMMKHREDTRKKHYKDNSENWYIERGNGREEARVLDPREQQYKKKRR